MDGKTIKITNFKLNIFRNLLEQSLIVDNQLMLEFTDEIIKSASFSSTRSFIKLWTIPLVNLLAGETKENVLELDVIPKEKIHFPTFNFYILKGDLFNRYLSVHNTDTVDLEFVLHEIKGKYQAANITITGKSENNSPLVTTFTLTTEEMITNKIDDYTEIIKECTPNSSMIEFTLTSNQIQEIKRLIKKLHKATSDNTAFLTFTINFQLNKVTVNDKVFSIDFLLAQELNKKSANTEILSFNILKSDFIVTGNHTFSLFTNDVEEKVILGAKFANGIIWCLSAKVSEKTLNLDDSAMDATIDSLNLSEYVID